MKIISIKENSDFKRAYYKGRSIVKKRIVLYYRKNRIEFSRLGITVSPKVGNAVVRNRIRRLIKENYRILSEGIECGFDIVLVARSCSAYCNFYDIQKDMREALYESGLIKRNDFCE